MSLTLLVLAAGMGRRYGGLKQIEAVGPAGEAIIDYSVYDALRAGFDKLVFVIRRDIEKDFRAFVGDKFAARIDTDYVFQEMVKPETPVPIPPERQKPWGTAHAILAARNTIGVPFAVINADDFYGAEAFAALARFLAAADDPTACAMVGYELGRTLSPHGTVSRGVCQVDDQGRLVAVTERTKIAPAGDDAEFVDDSGVAHRLPGDAIVSMNFWGFHPSIFAHLHERFLRFRQENPDDPKAEFYIPSVVSELIDEGHATVRVLPTGEDWFGVTYREDKNRAVAAIRGKIEAGVYPEDLWR